MATGTLVGTYRRPDGTPMSGTVSITPSVPVVRAANGDALIAGKVQARLDSEGYFSVPLAASDDPTLDPVGVTYTVSLRGLPPVSGVFVLADSTVDMGGIAPVDPEAPQYAAVVGPRGLSAYEIAVLEGFDGTEAQWLGSLAGTDGADSDVSSAEFNALATQVAQLLAGGGGGSGGGSLVPDPANSGFYLSVGGLFAEDPANPGYYLIGA